VVVGGWFVEGVMVVSERCAKELVITPACAF